MLDINVDRMLNAIGVLLVGAAFLIFGNMVFGRGSNNTFTQMVRGTDGYSISYDLNTGSGEFKDVVVDIDENNYTIPNSEPVKESHVFLGWVNSVDSEIYYPGTDVVVEHDIVYKAKWKANTHNVYYDLNGGSGIILDEKVGFNESYTVTGETPFYEGFHLIGWKSNIDGKIYAPNDPVDIKGSTRFTAIWETNMYTVGYEGVDKTIYKDQEVAHGNYFEIELSKPVKDGYVFHGWLNKHDGKIYDTGDSFRVYDEDLQLVPQWSNKNYKITYDLNDGHYTGLTGDAPDIIQYGSYGDKHKTPADEPYRKGFVFGGWVNSINNLTYQPQESFEVTSNVKLTADWLLSKYRVTYDLDGGAGEFNSALITSGETYKIYDKQPTKHGYVFNGWKYSKDNTIVESSGTITVEANTVLTADWKPDIFTLSFALNGGDGVFDDIELDFESSYHIPQTEPSKVGETFEGWLSSSDNKLYLPTTDISLSEDTVLMAQWSGDEHVIHYDLDGGVDAVLDVDGEPTTDADGEIVKLYPDATIAYGSKYRISNKIPTQYGYTFKSWLNSADEKSYAPGASIDVYEDIDLKAEWNVNQYTIKYNLNGGTGDFPTDTQAHGVDYQIEPGEPTREGYQFIGWRNTLTDELVEGGKHIRMIEDLSLKAEWLLISHRVEYDLMAGDMTDVFSKSYFVSYGETFTISNDIPTRAGFVFKRWIDEATGKTYSRGQRISVPDDMTLSAEWTPADFTITYNLNGGSGSSSAFRAVRGKHDSTFTISTEKPKITGPNLLFTGWKDITNGDGTLYGAGDIYRINQDATLVAQYGYTEYTIEYDHVGLYGTAPGETEDIIMDYGQGEDAKLELTDNLFVETTEKGHTVVHEPTLYGRDLTSWVSNIDGREYQPGDKINPGIDMKLTAKWELAKYDLVYDMQGGSNSLIKNEIMRHEVDHTISKHEPYKIGHTFRGWTRTDTGEHVDPGDTLVQPVAGITLEAKWTINQYDISYDFNQGGPNGGSYPSANLDYFTLIRVSDDIPYRLGYNFTGWRNTENGRTYQPGQTFNLGAGDTVLVAQWSIKRYTLSYDLNGGRGSFGSITQDWNTTFRVSGGTPIRDSYNFMGWYRSDTGTTVSRGASITALQDVHLTAQWQLKPIQSITRNVSHSSSSGPSDNDRYHNISIGNLHEVLSVSTPYGYVNHNSTSGNTARINVYGKSYSSMSGTPADSKYISGHTSSSYNSNGYRTNSLSRYQAGGTVIPRDTMWVTDQDYSLRVAYVTYDGTKWVKPSDWHMEWHPNKPADPPPRVWKSSGAYSGYIYEDVPIRKLRWQRYYDYPSSGRKGERFMYREQLVDYYYSGYIVRPEQDTRYYRYEGYAYRPDTRVWYFDYNVTINYREK